MAQITKRDQLVINELLDHGVFTTTPLAAATQLSRGAIADLKKPSVQKRIGFYFKNMFGIMPENFQENLLFLLGTEKLSPVQVHVLLATVKTIINEPELQNNQADRAIATQKIVRQVHSEVTELDERELLRTIDALFVKRFGLFTPDRLEDDSENVPAEIDDYWEVHPDFNEFTQNLVNYLVNTQSQEEVSEIQKVNRVLLTEQFMSPKANPQLWSTLAVNKQEIAEQWAQGGRFVLEIGDRYALLLDTQRQPSVAKPYLVALAVAHQLGAGVAAADLTALIRKKAVAMGLTAHTLNDAREDPALFAYYRWVMTHCFQSGQVNELTARLIGMAFTSANVFETDLPQPLTLNPWQLTPMLDFPLKNKQAVVIENNGVFALLHQEHPDRPLILQSGNDFNDVYVRLIQRLEERGMRYAYLGDIDSAGIRMADRFASLLKQTPAEAVAALQTPRDVRLWLAELGKRNSARTRALQVTSPVFQAEMVSVTMFGKFVEQEQLMPIYTQRIADWLKQED